MWLTTGDKITSTSCRGIDRAAASAVEAALDASNPPFILTRLRIIGENAITRGLLYRDPRLAFGDPAA